MLYFNDTMQSPSAMPLMIVNHNILSWIIQPILYMCVYIYNGECMNIFCVCSERRASC